MLLLMAIMILRVHHDGQTGSNSGARLGCLSHWQCTAHSKTRRPCRTAASSDPPGRARASESSANLDWIHWNQVFIIWPTVIF
jgi:hypothetical protein